MGTVCKKDMCTGCMACVESCLKNAIKIVDTMNAYNAVIDDTKCIKCNRCYGVCQINQPIEKIKPKMWFQGWSEDVVRKRAASGGFATELARSFVKNGGVVCGCVFENSEFIYKMVDCEAEVIQFAGSKYVKSNPVRIYNRVITELIRNKRVLFIGLPCHVAALKKYVGCKFEDQLYTVDLICHGTPSPQFLEAFLNQHGTSLQNLHEIHFREKRIFQVNSKNYQIGTIGISDKYSIAFLNAMTYTNNCYKCEFACKERVSDITIGDSWGSELSDQEQRKGVSLALCQTEKGIDLIKRSKLHLESVDLENAIKNNHQLESPSIKPQGYNDFFSEVKSGKKIDALVWKYYPKWCFRQLVKWSLIKLRIIKS